MSRVVRVYDPVRNPAEWNLLLRGSEVAVFMEDATTGQAAQGPDGTSVCEIFPDAESAGIYCRGLTMARPQLLCLVFDSRGRSGDPVAVYQNPALDRRELSSGFRRWSSVSLVVVSIVLIWWDWRSDFDRMWPSILAWKFVTTALVLIVWEATLIVERRLRRQASARQASGTGC